MNGNIISAARLKPNGLHLGHYIGNFSKRKSENIDYSLPYIFIIEDLFPFRNFSTNKLNQTSIPLLEDLYACAMKHNYNFKVAFLSDIMSYQSTINSLLLEFINVNHLRGIHPKRNYLRETADNIQLSEFLFIFFEAYYILGLNGKYVFMNDDNLPFVNYSRSLAKRINNSVGNIFSLPYLETGLYTRLKGFDGERMSKSRNNEIYLTDTSETINYKIEKLFSNRKCLKYVRFDNSGFYRHINSPISEEFIPFQYIDLFCIDDAAIIKSEFTQGKVNINDLKQEIKKGILNLLLKINQDKLTFKRSTNLNEKISEDLIFIKEILNKNELKISQLINENDITI